MPVAAATRVEVYDIVCQAGTPITAPVEVAMFDPGDFDVIGVTIVIPDGHAGTTGIALAIGHQRVLPRNPNSFISGNDEEPQYALKGYPRGAPWTVFVCNTDAIDHSWEIRWEFDDSPSVQLPTLTATPIAPEAVYTPASIVGA